MNHECLFHSKLQPSQLIHHINFIYPRHVVYVSQLRNETRNSCMQRLAFKLFHNLCTWFLMGKVKFVCVFIVPDTIRKKSTPVLFVSDSLLVSIIFLKRIVCSLKDIFLFNKAVFWNPYIICSRKWCNFHLGWKSHEKVFMVVSMEDNKHIKCLCLAWCQVLQ